MPRLCQIMPMFCSRIHFPLYIKQLQSRWHSYAAVATHTPQMEENSQDSTDYQKRPVTRKTQNRDNVSWQLIGLLLRVTQLMNRSTTEVKAWDAQAFFFILHFMRMNAVWQSLCMRY